MAAIKEQVFRINTGQSATDNCDFTGDRAHLLTGAENDFHRTIEGSEIDPAPDALLEVVREFAPKGNAAALAIEQAAQAMGIETIASKAASLLGLEGDGPVGIRTVIMDS